MNGLNSVEFTDIGVCVAEITEEVSTALNGTKKSKAALNRTIENIFTHHMVET